jgi:hypothetical protein
MEIRMLPPKPETLNPDSRNIFNPHVVIIQIDDILPAQVKEYPFYEDALQKYLDLERIHPRKLILAKVVRQHGEG